jgi:hypothetical protein
MRAVSNIERLCQHFKKAVTVLDCLNLEQKLIEKSLDRFHIGAIVLDIKIMKKQF